MSTTSGSPSNLKLALDAYDAQQRRQAALVEAQRIGTLIHIQEQQLMAAKYLAKQRKSQRRRAHLSASAPTANSHNHAGQPTTTTASTVEDAIEDEEEDVGFEPVVSGESRRSPLDDGATVDVAVATTAAPTPICPSLAARRAARSASKRTSPMQPVLESEQESEAEHEHEHEHEHLDIAPLTTLNHAVQRWATHKRRPQEPYASLAERSQWKPDSQARVCDNVLCKKPFSLFGPQSRHHCRRCGNVFCASCLSHTEVLYDMQRSKWDAFPEAVLASIFPPTDHDHVQTETERQHQQRPSPSSPGLGLSSRDQRASSPSGSVNAVPTSPASSTSTNLSSSVESGSSRASGSSSGYFGPTATTHHSSPSRSSSRFIRAPITDPLQTVSRPPTWHTGTNDLFLPSPFPSSWRDALLDIASEEKVCEECHDELWDRPTPLERVTAKRAFMREREEMAWALRVVGLDRWEEILRAEGLTMKPRRGEKSRRGSENTTSTGSGSSSRRLEEDVTMPVGVPGVEPELGLDYLDRPTFPHVYAWVTPPNCIRFASSAFKAPTHLLSTAPSEETTPSPFGMLKSPAKFLPPPLPPAYLAAQHALALQLASSRIPNGEEREDQRQTRYSRAVKELVRAAYLKGVPCDHLDGGVLGVRYLVEPTPLEVAKGEVVKRALDWAARWRGDPVGR